MARKKRSQRFGELPPRYRFVLNPYPDHRASRCPRCEAKTGQRKLPLLIHADPGTLVTLGYTNRYCKDCDLLVGHRHEIEGYLTRLFADMDPDSIGNPYLIIGTVEKKAWREGMKQQQSVDELCAHTRDFKRYDELRMTQGGWYHEDTEPPEREPPEPTEWVKQ